MKGNSTGLIILIVFGLSLFGVNTAFCNWAIETVDTIESMRSRSAVAVDPDGNPHAVYFKDDNLYHAFFNGAGYTIEAIDTISSYNLAYFPSIAIDASGVIHIAYSNGDIKYATFDGDAWVGTTVMENPNRKRFDSGFSSPGMPVGYTSIALDGAGLPHITCHNGSLFDLELYYFFFNGASWSQRAVIDDNVVGNSSLAIDSSNRPHVSYFTVSGSSYTLRHATLTDGEWEISALDYIPNSGDFSSLALDASGTPQIAYYDGDDDDLAFTKKGEDWSKEIVDSQGDAGELPSMVIDGEGNPHIAYVSYASSIYGHVKYAVYNGSSWRTEMVDNGGRPSLAMGADGSIFILYYDSKEFKMAKRVDGDAAPAAPVLNISVDGSTVTMSWTSVNNATGYVLYYADYPNAQNIGQVPMGAGNSITVDLPGLALYIAVQAYNSAGPGGISNIGFFDLN